jgi:hypothetical protein
LLRLLRPKGQASFVKEVAWFSPFDYRGKRDFSPLGNSSRLKVPKQLGPEGVALAFIWH